MELSQLLFWKDLRPVASFAIQVYISNTCQASIAGLDDEAASEIVGAVLAVLHFIMVDAALHTGAASHWADNTGQSRSRADTAAADRDKRTRHLDTVKIAFTGMSSSLCNEGKSRSAEALGERYLI